MKFAILLLWMVFPCFAQQESSMVRFSNGDRLTGDLLTISKKNFTWKSKSLKEPAEFGLSNVLDLEFSVSAPPFDRTVAAHEAIIGMTNGDTFRGQIAGITDSKITLASWYADDLVLNRAYVKSVEISRIADIYYRGPNSMEEWARSVAGDTWKFRDDTLHAEFPGAIAREINFPDQCVISFQVVWRGEFRPKIVFFSKDSASPSEPKSGYEMIFEGNSVHIKKAGTNHWLGHSTSDDMPRENEKARIQIMASLKKGQIGLCVDGKVIDVWQDDGVDFESLGKGFHIITQDYSSLRISDIVVSGWDGYLENVPKRKGRIQGGFFELGGRFDEVKKSIKEVIPEGHMLLRNGDTIEGEVMGIEGEEITLKTPFAEVKFPVGRLKKLSLSNDAMEQAKLENGDVRASFADGSRIVFRLDAVEDNTLVGYSQNFGTAKFRTDALKRIEFNLYPKNGKTIRPSEEILGSH